MKKITLIALILIAIATTAQEKNGLSYWNNKF